MKQKILIHYIILGIILLGGILTFYYVQPDTKLQFIVGVITSVGYVLWGIIHHALNGDLHQKIVIEYLLIGMIAVILLATVLRT